MRRGSWPLLVPRSTALRRASSTFRRSPSDLPRRARGSIATYATRRASGCCCPRFRCSCSCRRCSSEAEVNSLLLLLLLLLLSFPPDAEEEKDEDEDEDGGGGGGGAGGGSRCGGIEVVTEVSTPLLQCTVRLSQTIKSPASRATQTARSRQ